MHRRSRTERETTMFRRTSRRCSEASRGRGRSRSSTSGADPGATSSHFALSGTKQWVSTVRSNSSRFARAATGCEVIHQDFLALALQQGRFHGIFANASLFHVPTQELPRVLGELRDALRSRGVLFSSNPRGDGAEGWQGDRYGAYHDLTNWRRFVTAAGFDELGHYYRPPGRPLREQPWLATVWRKVG
jgi:SAM-dependent methyltransferase